MAFLNHAVRLVAALLLAAALVAPAAAQESLRLAEQEIKAGLLYNFLRYTQAEQPSHTEDPAIVCIYGSDPFNGRLASMEGRTVNQRRIEIRSVRTYAEMDACSLLFLNAEQRAHWPQVRTYLARRAVLTVSDYDGFARTGGMIEFTRINNRVGVRINMDAVDGAHFTVQDRLLRLASIVRTDPQ